MQAINIPCLPIHPELCYQPMDMRGWFLIYPRLMETTKLSLETIADQAALTAAVLTVYAMLNRRFMLIPSMTFCLVSRSFFFWELKQQREAKENKRLSVIVCRISIRTINHNKCKSQIVHQRLLKNKNPPCSIFVDYPLSHSSFFLYPLVS